MSQVKNVIAVTPDQLGIELAQIEKAVPVTIVATTEVVMNKNVVIDGVKEPNPYHGRVFKTQESNVFVAMDYETAVNKRLIKEGKDADFEVQARTWGESIGKSPVIMNEKNGQVTYYLQTFFVTSNKPKVSYEVRDEDGTMRIADKSEFEAYLKPASTSSSQGLDNEIQVRSFKLSNIKEVRANGKIYVVQA